MAISNPDKRFVRERAGDCCEYCRIRRTDETGRFHVEHIVPRKHHGTDARDNLCFSCYQCNVFKGPIVAGPDPVTGGATFLFNPRTQTWAEHFRIEDDGVLIGLTPEGRLTVDVMRMNDEDRVLYRQYALSISEYPCQPPGA
jgi:hypothetical protein